MSEMLIQDINDDSNFGTRLLKAQAAFDSKNPAPNPPDASQWLQYWNDAETISSNLRKVEHWLQRARQQQSV